MNSDILKKFFDSNIEKTCGMRRLLDSLENVKEGDIVMIDNLSREGIIDKTCIGYYKKPNYEPNELYFEGVGWIIEDIGIPIEFEEGKCKQFYVTSEVPDALIIKVKDYKKLQPHFAELNPPSGVAHYNSILLSGKNLVDARLKKYNSSLDAFLDSLK